MGSRSGIQVVHLICRKGIGGVQSQFATYERYLHKLGWSNFRIVEPCSRKSFFGYLGLLREVFFILIKSRDPRYIFHVYNGLISIRYLLLFYFVRPRNLVFHERGNAWNVSKDKEWIVKTNARLSRRILCNSNATLTLLHEVFGVPKSKMEVLYNGVFDRDMIAEPPSTVFPGKQHIDIGYVGRLEPHKGVHVLLEAMALLDKKKYRLTVVGDGSQKPDLEALSQRLGVAAEFTGRLDNPETVFQKMDIIVVPSIREPLGNVIIEAGSLARFVIASRVDGIPEIVDSGQSGILLDPVVEIDESLRGYKIPIPRFVVDPENQSLKSAKQLDARVLAETISAYAEDDAGRTAMASNLFESIHERFSVQKYTEQLDRFYQELGSTG